MRLFIALDPPDSVRNQIIPLLDQVTGGKTLPPHQLHLTLRFIGETATEQFQDIKEALIGLRPKTFKIKFQGVGCFPSEKRPKVLWVGVPTSPPLLQLKGEIDKSLLTVGIEEEGRPFHPHLTLARFKTGKPHILGEFLGKNLAFQTDPFDVNAFHLYSSTLTPKGAIHNRELSVEFS